MNSVLSGDKREKKGGTPLDAGISSRLGSNKRELLKRKEKTTTSPLGTIIRMYSIYVRPCTLYTDTLTTCGAPGIPVFGMAIGMGRESVDTVPFNYFKPFPIGQMPRFNRCSGGMSLGKVLGYL